MESKIEELFLELNEQERTSVLIRLYKHLNSCQKSFISNHIVKLTKVNFLKNLPKEISCKILMFLDAKSLCKSAAVSKHWKELSNSEQVWQHLCGQHVYKECTKCGWCLPSLDSDVFCGWKRFYEKRMRVEKNWRLGNYTTSILKGHTDGITALYFSNNYLISGGWDQSIIVWDIKSGEILHKLTSHSGCVRGLKFDDDKLISVSMDKSWKIWNYKQGRLLRSFDNAHDEGITCVDFDETLVITGSNDNSIKIWNFKTGENVQLTGHTDWINRVLLYKQKSVISCSDDNTVRIWDVESRSCVKIFEHGAQVQGLSIWSPKYPLILNKKVVDRISKYPEFIISGDLEGFISLWDVSNDTHSDYYGNKSGIWSICMNQQRIISGTVDGSVKIWNHNGELKSNLKLHEGDIKAVQMDEVKIISGSEDSSIIIWNFDLV
eukprot:NODE_40_length_29852_cov_0.370215.p5 type:complete len:435 gc:universal NODE_40_length_29852_cov_0.370215:6164-4860(-)